MVIGLDCLLGMVIRDNGWMDQYRVYALMGFPRDGCALVRFRGFFFFERDDVL